MGTNYYLHQKPDCECCGRPFEPLHIGKSSGGWCFGLRIMPEDCITTLNDWRALWLEQGSFIRDEYGERISVDEMEHIITERGWDQPKQYNPSWLQSNSAIPGPNGLVRHRVDGRFCVGHGEGTWDYISGAFS